MNSFKKAIMAISITVGVIGVMAGAYGPAPSVYASSASSACEAIAAGADCNEETAAGGSGTTVSGIVASAIEILSYIVGIAAIIMVIIGGFKYITSNGDASKASSAKNTLIYALIGILVAGLAQVIVQFVIDRITSP